MAAMLYATVEEAKDAGNEAFASDDAAGAIAAYSAGLNMISTAAAKPDAALQATLYTNRAMAHWKAGDMQACEADCTAALELEPRRVKALYKRAQSYEARGKDALALKDLHRICEIDKTNKAAVALAAAVKDKISRQAAKESPLQLALAELTKANGDKLKALRAIAALTSVDPSAGATVMRNDGISAIWSCCTDETLAAMALRALSECCQHKIVGVSVLKSILECNGAITIASVGDLVNSTNNTAAAATEEIPVAAIAFLVKLLEHDDALLQIVDAAATEEAVTAAFETVIDSAAKVWSQAIAHPTLAAVRNVGMEAQVMWCTESAESATTSSTSSSSSSASSTSAAAGADARQAVYRRKQLRSWLARDKGMSAAKHSMLPLYKLLSSDNAAERRKASAATSRLVRAVAGAITQDSIKEKDKSTLQAILTPYMQFEAGEHAAVPGLKSESRLHGTQRRVSVATAVANADPDVGTWALSLNGCIAEVMTLAATGDELSQEIAGEAICSAASFDSGRPLLGPVVESGLIFSLMESKSAGARSSAASGYAKLGMISQALQSDSDDITKLLNVSLDLIATAAPAAEKERAVEVLTFLVSKTKVKEELGKQYC
eukprot:20210-Heterococcus_DN1.PRE.2